MMEYWIYGCGDVIMPHLRYSLRCASVIKESFGGGSHFRNPFGKLRTLTLKLSPVAVAYGGDLSGSVRVKDDVIMRLRTSGQKAKMRVKKLSTGTGNGELSPSIRYTMFPLSFQGFHIPGKLIQEPGC
jgi:hypothetical protein